MKKSTIIWLSTATTLCLSGIIMFAVVMTIHNWDFRKLGTESFLEQTISIDDEFNNISINVREADVKFASSTDKKCSVQIFDNENMKYSATVEENTLAINSTDKRTWHDYIGIKTDSPRLTVYLPEEEYASLLVKSSSGDTLIPKNIKFGNIDISVYSGDVNCFSSVTDKIKISSSSGDINVRGVAANTVEISASTGDVELSDIVCQGDISASTSSGEIDLDRVNCNNLITNAKSGDTDFKSVVAKEKFQNTASSGDISFFACDANEIFAQTHSGDIEGSLLTDKVFITETNSGFVDVPKSVSGGKCEIKTISGNVKFKVNKNIANTKY